MRYLKLYEDHNQYYQKATIDQFRSDIRPTIYFDYSSVINLRKLINDNGITDFEFTVKKGSNNITFAMFNTKEYGVDILMLEDEWYKVSLLKFGNPNEHIDSTQEYYLCDQWGGFVKLLKDKGII